MMEIQAVSSARISRLSFWGGVAGVEAGGVEAEPVVDSAWDGAESVPSEVVPPDSFPDGDVAAGDVLSTGREVEELDWDWGVAAVTGAGAGDRLEAAADCGAAAGSR
jgi:hypothetical protein